jgi:hypothetical protein
MWRYFVGGAAALLLAVAGMFLFRGAATPETPLPPAPPAALSASAQDEAPLPDQAPRASDRSREQKRFDRYDKDRNDAIAREEFLVPRRKAFAKLDVNGDGRLSFDEWAVRTTNRFAEADKDKSNTLTRAEFATTAPKRRAPTRARCSCSPASAPREEASGDD